MKGVLPILILAFFLQNSINSLRLSETKKNLKGLDKNKEKTLTQKNLQKKNDNVPSRKLNAEEKPEKPVIAEKPKREKKHKSGQTAQTTTDLKPSIDSAKPETHKLHHKHHHKHHIHHKKERLLKDGVKKDRKLNERNQKSKKVASSNKSKQKKFSKERKLYQIPKESANEFYNKILRGYI